MKWKYLVCLITLFFQFSIIAEVTSQNAKSSELKLTSELQGLFTELGLSTDQKISIGVVLLSYAAEFKKVDFESLSKMKRLRFLRAQLKRFEKELKGILTRAQMKIYRKKKKILRREYAS